MLYNSDYWNKFMTPQIQSWVKTARNDFIVSPGVVLEIGSLNINGSIRQYFNDAIEYIGIDLQKGDGVDRIMNAHNISKVWNSFTFNTVICLETLEHDLKPWITITTMRKVLKQGGILLVSTPTFGFPLHRFPKDYYRFGEDIYRDLIFKDFEILRFSEVRDINNSPGICCIGQK